MEFLDKHSEQSFTVKWSALFRPSKYTGMRPTIVKIPWTKMYIVLEISMLTKKSRLTGLDTLSNYGHVCKDLHHCLLPAKVM